MKSLLAVLAMATALGGGYWKMNNPTAGLSTLKSQASQQVGGMASMLSGVSRQQIEQLNDELEASRTRQQETQTELDSNKQDLEQATSRLSTAEESLSELLGIMNGQQTILAEQQRINEQNLLRFNEIEQSTNSLTLPAAALAATDGTDSQFVGRLDSIEAQMSNLLGQITGDSNSVVDQIESLRASNAQERKDAMVELADALRKEQQNQLAEMKNSIASRREQELTQTTLAVREESQLAIESNARELRQQLSSLQNQFSALSALSGDAESAVTLTTNLDDRIADLENSIANIDDNAVFKRVEARIDHQIVDANEKLVALQEENDRQTGNVNNRLITLEEQINELDSSLDVLATASQNQTQPRQSDESVSALQAKVAELESRLQVTTSQFKIVSTRLDNLQKLGSLQNQPLANNSQQTPTVESDQQLAAANVQPESVENRSEESINRQSLARQDVSEGKAVEYKIYFVCCPGNKSRQSRINIRVH